MTLSSEVQITTSNTATEINTSADYSPLLLLPLAAAVAFHYTKKQLRVAKRKMVWQIMKMKLKSLFSFKKGKGLGLKLLLILLSVGLIIGVGVSLGWGTAIAFLLIFGLVALIMAGKD